jgi:riboflavin kinase/FMN adenylyltransferase
MPGLKVLSWDEFSNSQHREITLAAAVGVFDGLHRGHTELIGRVLNRDEAVKAVVTFRENPKKVLRPASYHGDLSTLEQKLEKLEALGLDLCVLIDFSGDFSKLSGRKFLSVLKESGNLRFLAVGFDFRCGHRLDTGAEDIKAFYETQTVETELLGAVHWAGHPISSSRIRKAVVEGRLDDASAMLGYPYEVDLRRMTKVFTGESAVYAVSGEQVQPPYGKYSVTTLGGDGDVETEATLENGLWTVEQAKVIETRFLRLKELVSRA